MTIWRLDIHTCSLRVLHQRLHKFQLPWASNYNLPSFFFFDKSINRLHLSQLACLIDNLRSGVPPLWYRECFKVHVALLLMPRLFLRLASLKCKMSCSCSQRRRELEHRRKEKNVGDDDYEFQWYLQLSNKARVQYHQLCRG